MKIIALSGLAQTGKTTAAEYLHAKHKFGLLTLAEPIKELASILLGEEYSWVEENKNVVHPSMEEVAPGKNITVRKILQTLGTEWGRNLLHPDIWINYVLKDLPWYEEHEWPGVVITDCRFDNEAIAVRKAGGIVCHIRRANAPSIGRHISEAGIDPDGSDYIYRNDSTLDGLYKNMDMMVSMYDKLVKMRR